MCSQHRMRIPPRSSNEGLHLSFLRRGDSARHCRGRSKAMAEFSRDAPKLDVGLLAGHVHTPVPTVPLQPGFERVTV